MMKRVLLLALGWGFVALGVAGLVLPFLQGILFLAIGFAILGRHSRWARRQLARLRRRFPRYAKVFDQTTERAEDYVQRHTRWLRQR